MLGFAPGLEQLSGGRDSARPPCERLPDKNSVTNAVASHKDLVGQIREVGPGVDVGVATPCDDQPDRAIVRVTYTTDAEWEDVNAILGREEGFGVPVELVSS